MFCKVFSQTLKSKNFPIVVMLKDYNDIWSSINEMYYSILSSQLDKSIIILISKHSKSSLHEVISVFCPQCLTRYSEEEAFTYLGCCPSCFRCPCCKAILLKHFDNEIIYCGMCLWESEKTNIQQNNYISSVDARFLQLSENFKNITCVKDFNRHNNILKEKNNIWQLEDLDNKLSVCSNKSIERNLANIYLTEDGINDSSIFTIHTDINMASASQKCENIYSRENKLSKLKPLNMKLHTKCTIRSRHTNSLQSSQQQRMNILVQPKALPLEGDSSSKIQRGKWWVKDSSAIHEIPFISVKKIPNIEELLCGDVGFIDIYIVNLKETPITISFIGKSAVHESFCKLDIIGNTSEVLSRYFLTVKSLATSLDGEVHYEDVLNSNKYLTLKLEGNEDELLKLDDNEDSFSDNKLDKSDDSVNCLWNYTISNNKAIVHVPVYLKSNNDEVYHDDSSKSESCFEVQLYCNIDVGVGVINEMPIKILF